MEVDDVIMRQINVPKEDLGLFEIAIKEGWSGKANTKYINNLRYIGRLFLADNLQVDDNILDNKIEWFSPNLLTATQEQLARWYELGLLFEALTAATPEQIEEWEREHGSKDPST